MNIKNIVTQLFYGVNREIGLVNNVLHRINTLLNEVHL